MGVETAMSECFPDKLDLSVINCNSSILTINEYKVKPSKNRTDVMPTV